MTKKDEEIKKKEAIAVAKSIINIPKYKVRGHETINIRADPDWGLDMPSGATSILVIYLNEP